MFALTSPSPRVGPRRCFTEAEDHSLTGVAGQLVVSLGLSVEPNQGHRGGEQEGMSSGPCL